MFFHVDSVNILFLHHRMLNLSRVYVVKMSGEYHDSAAYILFFKYAQELRIAVAFKNVEL